MNKQRRKELRDAIEELDAIRGKIERIKEDEDESRENMPESLQESEMYEQSEVSSENMDYAIDHITDAIGAVEEAIEGL